MNFICTHFKGKTAFSLKMIEAIFLPLLLLASLQASAAPAALKLAPIAGHYQCLNSIHGYNRQLEINLNPKIAPLNKRFFVFNLLFRGDSKSISGPSTGYMLYDSKRQIAVDYVENHNNPNIQGPGLMYFDVSNPQNVSFHTYFFEPKLNKLGAYQCTKSAVKGAKK